MLVYPRLAKCVSDRVAAELNMKSSVVADLRLLDEGLTFDNAIDFVESDSQYITCGKHIEYGFRFEIALCSDRCMSDNLVCEFHERLCEVYDSVCTIILECLGEICDTDYKAEPWARQVDKASVEPARFSVVADPNKSGSYSAFAYGEIRIRELKKKV